MMMLETDYVLIDSYYLLIFYMESSEKCYYDEYVMIIAKAFYAFNRYTNVYLIIIYIVRFTV
ncbi:hypothetical protein [Sporosarcina sp. P19]|uniref:hypothetical protein n=1 Tax=Sporosarcina sp. P19 TaxID=2048258 RepID=UPI001179FDDD|nr:hypothetical protein [Sporosarcina sp. P19]